MKPGPGLVVDHINGIPLDNRRENLRVASQKQNACNLRISTRHKKSNSTSQFKGVSKINYLFQSGVPIRWRAAIGSGNKFKHLGCFNTEVEAARAYDTAAKQYFGPFARLNFPDQIDVPPVSETYKQESFLCGTNRSDSETKGFE